MVRRGTFERSLLLVASMAAAWLSACRTAHAQSADVHVYTAEDSCPNGALLVRTLEPLVGDDAEYVLDDAPNQGGGQHISLRDAGRSYTVTVDGISREVVDPSHDCVERAQIAAVFIALNLREPPHGPHFGASLFMTGAYAPDIEHAAFGGGLGAWMRHHAFQLELSAELLSPVRVALAPSGSQHGAVDVLRVPVTLDVSYWLRSRGLRIGPTLGFVVDLLRMRGVGLVRPQSELRANPGLLAALDARLRLSSSLAASLRVGLDVFPRAYDLSVDPAGKRGHTPRLWPHVRLGLAWQFR